MGIIGTILVGGLAIGGYKYFKEEDFKESVNEKAGEVWGGVKEKAGEVKNKIFKKKM